MPNSILISIIIVNYNSSDYLKICLQSIYHFPPQAPFEIIVFDNHSQDNIHEIAEYFSEVNFIFHTVNLGFAAANNLAVQQSSGKYLLFLNPDTKICREIFPDIFKYAREHPRHALGIRLRREDGTIQVSTGNFPGIANMVQQKTLRLLSMLKIYPAWKGLPFFNRLRPGQLLQDRQLWDATRSQCVDWLSGAFIFLEKKLFMAAGMFNSAYFLFAEDMDFGLRLKKAGGHCFYFANAEIVHFSSVSLKDSPLRNQVLRRLSLIRFYQLNRGKQEYHLYRLLSGFYYLFAAIFKADSSNRDIEVRPGESYSLLTTAINIIFNRRLK